MPERRMTEIMREGQGFGEVLVQPKRPRERAGNLDDVQSVRQARAVMIAFVIDEDLRLMGEPPERRGMNDPVAVPPESIARWARRLGVTPAPALRRIGRINRPFPPGFDRHRNSCLWRMILSENRYRVFGIMRWIDLTGRRT